MTTHQLAAVEGLRSARAALRPLAVPMAVVAFALLTAVGGQVAVPLLGTPVPVTLQTLFVLLAGGAARSGGGCLLAAALPLHGAPWGAAIRDGRRGSSLAARSDGGLPAGLSGCGGAGWPGGWPCARRGCAPERRWSWPRR